MMALGRVTLLGVFFTLFLVETPVWAARYGPMLGEHVEHVFGDLVGLSPREIESLRREGLFN